MVWEQKWMLLMAFPFMFLGGITDFLFPDLISNVVDAMSAKDQDEVVYRLQMWLVIIVIGAVSTGLNSILFGITSERLGKSLRNKLFQSLIYKDTSFYDESRVGDLCKLPFFAITFYGSVEVINWYSSSVRWVVNILSHDVKITFDVYRDGRDHVHLLLEAHYLRNAIDIAILVLQ